MKTYTFDITPVPAPRMVRSDKWKKREIVSRYFAFRDEFILSCNKQGYALLPKLNITFFIPMPDSWSKKKKDKMNFEFHQQRPDIDNLTKSILDSFNKDDGFVHTIYARKFWAEEGKIIINVDE